MLIFLIFKFEKSKSTESDNEFLELIFWIFPCALTKFTASSQLVPEVWISILSTSKGVLSNKAANKFGVGGEIICEVY